jgi:7-cyano-7-deazaguanine synthase
MPNAVILLSGGLDSSTCLAYAAAQGYACYALSFAYGQKQNAELSASQRIAQQFKVIRHEIITLPIGQLGGSALTDDSIAVPDYTGSTDIPVTYVPARNTIMLSIALGFAEIIQAEAIFIGVNAVDYSNYPDCRPEYIHAFQTMANLATKCGVEGQAFTIHTPLMHLSKAEIIQLGHSLGLDYSQTVSCYRADTDGRACGTCHSCHLRKKGFADAHLPDPTRYQ